MHKPFWSLEGIMPRGNSETDKQQELLQQCDAIDESIQQQASAIFKPIADEVEVMRQKIGSEQPPVEPPPEPPVEPPTEPPPETGYEEHIVYTGEELRDIDWVRQQEGHIISVEPRIPVQEQVDANIRFELAPGEGFKDYSSALLIQVPENDAVVRQTGQPIVIWPAFWSITWHRIAGSPFTPNDSRCHMLEWGKRANEIHVTLRMPEGVPGRIGRRGNFNIGTYCKDPRQWGQGRGVESFNWHFYSNYDVAAGYRGWFTLKITLQPCDIRGWQIQRPQTFNPTNFLCNGAPGHCPEDKEPPETTDYYLRPRAEQFHPRQCDLPQLLTRFYWQLLDQPYTDKIVYVGEIKFVYDPAHDYDIIEEENFCYGVPKQPVYPSPAIYESHKKLDRDWYRRAWRNQLTPEDSVWFTEGVFEPVIYHDNRFE